MGVNKRRRTAHRNALEELAEDPSLIGLPGADIIEIEFPFYHNGVLAGEADLIFLIKRDPSSMIYVVEYKRKNKYKLRKKAIKQLFTAQDYLGPPFEHPQNLLFVWRQWGKYKTNQLTPSGNLIQFP